MSYVQAGKHSCPQPPQGGPSANSGPMLPCVGPLLKSAFDPKETFATFRQARQFTCPRYDLIASTAASLSW
jgi:hypothetical protein